MTSEAANVEQVSTGDLIPHPDNPRRGDVTLIAESIEANGWYGTIVAQRSTGHVLAGNHRLMAARDAGLATVPVYWADVDDATARRILLADNRISDVAHSDEAALIAILTQVAEDPFGVTGTGYEDWHLADLLATSTIDADALTSLDGHGQGADDGTLASHNVDVFFNASPVLAKIASAVGFRPGIISRSVSPAYIAAIATLSMDVGFVDNEFKDYDHDKHVEAVKALRPQYATVRDVMTRTQCEEAGIDYYPLEQILDYAAEVAEHADNVIVIPKYDCLDDIPDDYMLGYSVPTSYGGTPLGVEQFIGRRVHLLGGNWNRQRNALAILGESCVSLDNNHLMNISRFGQCYSSEGRHKLVADLLPGHYGNVVPMLLSMSAIIADLSRTGCTINGRRFASKEDAVNVPTDDIASRYADDEQEDQDV